MRTLSPLTGIFSYDTGQKVHKMESISMIVTLMVLTTAQGSRICNVSENQQCFGALGKSLFIVLTRNLTECSIQFKKNSHGYKQIKIKCVKNNDPVHKINVVKDLNETFKLLVLNEATKNDSGEYQLDTFDSDGKAIRETKIQLHIQAPVSRELKFSQECLSHGGNRITCMTDGDGVKFRWSLDDPAGFTHKQSYVDGTLILTDNTTGSLTCSVHNEVSSRNGSIQLSACIVRPSRFPSVSVVVASTTTVILLLTLIAGIILWKKSRTLAVTTGNDEGDEIVYADVRVLKSRLTEENPSQVSDMVLYGQVLITSGQENM